MNEPINVKSCGTIVTVHSRYQNLNIPEKRGILHEVISWAENELRALDVNYSQSTSTRYVPMAIPSTGAEKVIIPPSKPTFWRRLFNWIKPR